MASAGQLSLVRPMKTALTVLVLHLAFARILQSRPAPTAAVDNTFCQSRCVCKTGYGGLDCSTTASDLAAKDASRGVMCSTLYKAIQKSDPSTSIFDSFSSALYSAYNQYEVLSPASRAACFKVMEALADLASAGYLIPEQLPADDSDTTSSVQTMLNVLSDFVHVGNSSSVEAVVTSLSEAVMALLAQGQSGVLLTTTNLKLSFNKLRFSDVLGQEFSIPQNSAEFLYGTVTPTLQFTTNNPSEIINACSDFSSAHPSSNDLGNPNNYFSFSFGSWNANPFAEAERLKTVVMRTQTSTNNTVKSSGHSHDPLYYITYPFTSKQQFQNVSRLVKTGATGNLTFPVCSEYLFSVAQGLFLAPSVCKSCNVSTYDNTSITFVCYNMEALCGSGSSSHGRRLSATSNGQTVSQMGAALGSFSPVFTSVFGRFHVDVNAAIPVLIAVGGVVVVLLLTLIYFYQWDINDYYFAKYSNRIKYNYTSIMLGASPVGGNGNAQQAKQLLTAASGEALAIEDLAAEGSKGLGKLAKLAPLGMMNEPNRSDDALFILHNAFPAIVYQANDGESGSAGGGAGGDRSSMRSVQSGAHKSVMTLLSRNDYFSMFNPDHYNYQRAVKLIQTLIQIITILFFSTLFFYIFYPDRGQCESYESLGDCHYHKNLITQEYLCSWSESVKGGVVSKSCELRPPQLNVPFIMLLATVTTMISMPVVIVWNLLFLNMCATIPPSWFKFLMGDRSVEAEPVRPEPGQEEGEGGRYQVTNYPQRTTRKPVHRHQTLKETIAAPSNGSGSEGGANQSPEMNAELYYVNRITVEEEMEVLFQSIQRFYHQLDHHYSSAHPLHHQFHGFLSPIQAKMLYIYYSLGIDSNFHTVPLSLRQQLKYGGWLSAFFSSNDHHVVRYRNVYSQPTASQDSLEMTIHHAAYQRIKQKLQRSREESEEFVSFFREQMKGSEEDVVKERDAMMLNNIQLLQFFVFEQFPIYQKYLLYFFFHHTFLYSNMHLFNAMPADQRSSQNSVANQLLWLLKGAVLLGGLVYMVYFILNWSVISQNNTFESWGINYLIIVGEQLFIIQWIQNYFVQSIIYSLLLPKLQIIYATVYKKLIEMASRAPSSAASTPSHGAAEAANKGFFARHSFAVTPRAVLTGLSFRGSVSSVNMLPPDYSEGNEASAAGGLDAVTPPGWKDEFPVCQLLSPVARACKNGELNRSLVISRMINSFTDYDMVNLKSQLSELSMQFSRQPVLSRRFSAAPGSAASSGAANEGSGDSTSNNSPATLYYKEVAEWKQYSLFHLISIMLPLFMLQTIFQGLFSLFPFLSRSLSTKSFVLNGFHMSQFNILFSYVLPSLISLLVIVMYYFFINVPLPAAIITTVVVLLLVFFVTPRRSDQFWEALRGSGSGSSWFRGTGGRRRRGGEEGIVGASLGAFYEFFFLYLPQGVGRMVRLVFFPFAAQQQQQQTNQMLDQQWQRQNIPASLQSAISMVPSAEDGSTPVYDSYLLSLLASQHQTAAGGPQSSNIPSEIQQISAMTPFQGAGGKKGSGSAAAAGGAAGYSGSTGNQYYLSSLLDQSFYDEKKYEEYLLTKFKVRKPEDVNKRISHTLSSVRTAPLSDVGLNEHTIFVDQASSSPGMLYEETGGDEVFRDPRTVGVATISTVRHLRHLVAHILSASPSAGSASAATPSTINHRYYNLYHKVTEDVQIGLLRSVTIFYLQSVGAGQNETSTLNLLNHLFTVSEQIFRQPIHLEAQLPESTQTVDANDATEILQQFFQIFVPTASASGATTLSSSERTEIINDFYQFLVMQDFSWDRIPFPAFISWFRGIVDKTVKYKMVLQYSQSESGSGSGSNNPGGSKEDSEDGSGSGGSSGGRGGGRYQYQMNYQRIQRTAQTDTNRLTENLPRSTGDDDDSIFQLASPVIRSVKHSKGDSTSGGGASPSAHPAQREEGTFSSPRRVSETASMLRPAIPVQTSANPDQFQHVNPLRAATNNNNPKKVTLDLTKELKDMK